MLFISGYRRSRDNNKVLARNLYLSVLARSHSRKRRHRLSLASGRDKHQLVVGIARNRVDIYKHADRNVKISQLDSLRHNVYHASARHGYLSAVSLGVVYYLLNSVYVRRKRRHDNSFVLRLAEQAVKRLPYLSFAHGGAGAFRVGRIVQQSEHALAAQFRKPRKVDHLALDRRKIYFKISRVNDDSGRGVYRHTDRVRNRVVYSDKFHRHAARLHLVLGLYNVHFDRAQKPVLLKLSLDEPERERSAVKRHVKTL